MNRRRLTGLIALVAAVVVVAALIYFETGRNQSGQPSEPAVSTNELTPPAGSPTEAQPAAPGGSMTAQTPAAGTASPGGSMSAETPAAGPTSPGGGMTAQAPSAETPAPGGSMTAGAPTAETPAAAVAPTASDNTMAKAPSTAETPSVETPAPGSNMMAQTPPTEAPTAAPAAQPAPPGGNMMAEAPAAQAPAAETTPTAPQNAMAETPPAASAPPTSAQPPAAVAVAEPPATTTPKAPAAAAPTAAPVVPTFDIVRVEPSGDAVVAGRAEPGSAVEVLDGAAPVATAQADDRGDWAMALGAPLKPGTHDLAIRTTSKDEAAPVLSHERVAVSVPEPGSKDVLVVVNKPDAPSRVLQMPNPEPPAPGTEAAKAGPASAGTPAASAPATAASPSPKPATETAALEPNAAGQPAAAGGATAKSEPPAAAEAPPTQPPAPAKPAPHVAVTAVEADTDGMLYVAGTAATGEKVRVYLDGQPLGEAKPSPSGTWLLEIHKEVAPGTYTVRADQIGDSGGTVIARAEVPFSRQIDVANLKASGSTGGAAGADVSGKAPEVQTVIIKRGDNLWNIARDTWGRGIRWSTLYQANKDQIRNPHWIYPGQVFVMPASPNVVKD